MNEFKVGDKVECLLYGKGEVVQISDHYSLYPVRVDFLGNTNIGYTRSGKYSTDSRVALTKGTWKVEEVLPEVTYKQGELVWADLGCGDGWQVFEYHSKGIYHCVVSPKKRPERELRYANDATIRKFKDNPYDINY